MTVGHPVIVWFRQPGVREYGQFVGEVTRYGERRYNVRITAPCAEQYTGREPGQVYDFAPWQVEAAVVPGPPYEQA